MQKLPIGIQTLKKLIDGDYIYIDKTHLALDLIENYQYSFLSRPRRFGKSLFLDTLKNIFEGNKELFKGLYIYDKWDFEDKYPVIKIDWAGDFKTLESTKKRAISILKENQQRLGIECESINDPSNCFEELIHKAYEKYKKPVVILIDEYDKPILDNIEDTKRALENRDFLRGFYVMMKANDTYIKFAFLTGISKFSKANIFSGLNMLEDISLTPKFGNICGYTQSNIENEFKEHLIGADLKMLKNWYNGYNFLGDKVYNPFDILQFIKNDFMFRNYWWLSGNPYFLITLFKEKNYNLPSLENITISEDLLSTFEIDKIKLEVLLFQAGYLTIDKMIALPFGGFEYKLRVPNREVSISLNNLFLEYLIEESDNQFKKSIYISLMESNLDELKNTFISLFASLANNNYTKNDIANYEGYYASIFYAYLGASGLNLTAEDVTNLGRVDLTIDIDDKIYIIEFKVDSANSLKQIKEKKYYQKYLSSEKEVYIVGIEFCKKEKNIASFKWEKLL